jgi:hypothetical protein
MKQGYLISKNRSATTFFTASSSYDRPRWTALAEATVYHTAELATLAARKLYKNGAYEAKILSMEEAMEFAMPKDDQDVAPAVSLPGEAPTDAPADGEAGEDGMVAKDQEEACPECEHAPCTCDNAEGDTDPAEDGEADVQSDVDAALDGDDDGITDDDITKMDPSAPDEGGEEDLLSDPRDEMRESAPELKVADPAVVADDTGKAGPVAGEADDKIALPANVKNELKAAIAKFKKEADTYNTRDDGRASFAMTVADAFDQLLQDLEQGTVEGMKMAQIHLTSYMSPITSNLPTAVMKFIHQGGKKASLKDLFDTKRTDKKA